MSEELHIRVVRYSRRLLVAVSVAVAIMECATASDQDLLDVIARVGPQGAGSVEARQACLKLALRDTALLPDLLVAMDTDNPVAANWYRSVFEEIVSREVTPSGIDMPMEFFKRYVSDPERSGRPRRLVLQLINRLEPQFETKWLLGRLDDEEFRQDAVALVLKSGERAVQMSDAASARRLFHQAFEHARERSQVAAAAQHLRTLGESADVVRHLGLVTDWWFAGPFPAPHKSGFSAVFDPETQVDLQAEYIGKSDRTFGWVRHQSDDPMGLVNLVSVLGKTDEAVAYAWTEIRLDQSREAQLRCGADDCCLVWLNGEPVSSHEQWLNGTRFDRFINPIRLNAGRNTILVKVCQGPLHRNPEVFNNWSLQLRLCDNEGRGIEFTNAVP